MAGFFCGRRLTRTPCLRQERHRARRRMVAQIISAGREQIRCRCFVFFSTGPENMKLIEKIAEDRPLRYAFAGLAVLLMFGMVLN